MGEPEELKESEDRVLGLGGGAGPLDVGSADAEAERSGCMGGGGARRVGEVLVDLPELGASFGCEERRGNGLVDFRTGGGVAVVPAKATSLKDDMLAGGLSAGSTLDDDETLLAGAARRRGRGGGSLITFDGLVLRFLLAGSAGSGPFWTAVGAIGIELRFKTCITRSFSNISSARFRLCAVFWARRLCWISGDGVCLTGLIEVEER